MLPRLSERAYRIPALHGELQIVRTELHDLQKLCYSFGLGSCQNVRVNPDVLRKAEAEGERCRQRRSEPEASEAVVSQ